MNLQSMNCRDCKKYSDRCEFDDWCVGVEVIDAVDLTESSGDQSCLQPDDLCAFVLFVPECEFVGDDLAISGAWNEVPCVVLDERIDFVLNGFLPLLSVCGMVDSFLYHCWLVLVVWINVPRNLCHASLS